MTQHEKVLAGCLVGAIVAAGGYTLAKSKVYEPRQRLKADISNEIARRERLEVRLQGAEKTVRAWHKQTGQTLHAESFEAHQAFRKDVGDLLDRNKLSEDRTISTYKVRREKKGARQGFVELPLSVRVKGKLGDLVNFLRDLYQRPYVVRVDKLRLSAELGRRSRSKKGRGTSAEPKLSITMTLSTLVLPKIKDVEHSTIDLKAMNDPEAEPLLVSDRRLSEEDPIAYNEIPRNNIFKLYEPPPAPPPPRVDRKQEAPKVVEQPEKPPADPRRDAHKFVLSGVGQTPEGPVAYVIHTDEPTEPPKEYRLNESADDGKVVLIVPEGMVVRVPPGKGRSDSPQNYFYPLGGNFKEREEVSPSEHPDIEHMLRLVLKQ
ncbi:MAG: GspMb/PilO family protein [Phycisphaerae bacterium]